jgi:8-oxo-dGTP diphosphatase
MKFYTAGGIFSKERNEILLIRKNRPDWQKGKFNFVGGKMEEGETPLQTMRREAFEETTIKDDDWKEIAVLEAKHFEVTFFAIYNQDIKKIKALTDEELYPMMIKDIYNPNYYFYNDIMKNLRVVISLALDDSGIKLPIILTE